MALQTSGAISLNQIHIEAGGASASQASLNDTDIRGLIGKASTASNSFSEYYGAASAAPTATYIGHLQTTSDGFPDGWLNFSTGNKIIVMALSLAGKNNTYVSVGGTNLTQGPWLSGKSTNVNVWQNQGTVAIYYLETTLSGTRNVQGNGGTGRSRLYAWEITGYNSATPSSTGTVQNNNANSYEATLSLTTQYNGVTIGAGLTEDTNPINSVTVDNSDLLYQKDLESATNHFSWRDEGASSGTTNYRGDQNNPANNQNANSTIMKLAGAHWK